MRCDPVRLMPGTSDLRLEKVNVEGTFLTLREFARHFIQQGTGGDIILVSTKNVPSPGAGFGPAGEGYLRLALVENENRLRQAVRQIARCLGTREGARA